MSWRFTSTNVVEAIYRGRNASSRIEKSWEDKSSCKRNSRNLQRAIMHISRRLKGIQLD
ncbi:hypothetical protein J3E69DRAFT_333725 [Trichoderma sp. SZMC 28015]